jgi:hypothetical protein
MPEANTHTNYFPYDTKAILRDGGDYAWIEWGKINIFGDSTYGPSKDQLERIANIINEPQAELPPADIDSDIPF